MASSAQKNYPVIVRIQKAVLWGIVTLSLLSGCGDSAQEKRNKFDACVIQWLKTYGYDFAGYNGAFDAKAEASCAYHLE